VDFLSTPLQSFFSLQQFFSLVILFPSKIFPHQKAKSKRQKPKQKASYPKAKAKNQRQKPKVKVKGKKPLFLLQGSFINSGKQGGAEVFGEGHDIVTGETCAPASLNANNLGEIAILLLGLCQSPKSR
jgi:hypothetical protein